MKRIFLIGNGAREHIIATALKNSPQDIELVVFAKATNPGLVDLADDYLLGDICDPEVVAAAAEEAGDIDFAIIGPEAPFEAGVTEALEKIKIPVCSPNSITGKLETSKGFTRELVAKYNIPGNPIFKTYDSTEGMKEFFEELGEDFVVKSDGLNGGKGVKVSGDHLHGIEEGMAFAKECIEKDGSVVVEEKFVGQEFSLMSFCDGVNTVEMPPIQDHKRAFDGDKGPNTGGMGTYSCGKLLPFITEKDIEEAAEITKLVAAAIEKETGKKFKGVMYGGFMATAKGVRLIEYNARFGDPEAMNALTLLESDFVEICEAIINGNLDQIDVKFSDKATVCLYVVPEGYPTDSVKDKKIEIGELPDGVDVYFASVDDREDGLYLCGSRALAFVASAETVEDARKLAFEAVKQVEGPVFYRSDIGTEEVLSQKVEMMSELRTKN